MFVATDKVTILLLISCKFKIQNECIRGKQEQTEKLSEWCTQFGPVSTQMGPPTLVDVDWVMLLLYTQYANRSLLLNFSLFYGHFGYWNDVSKHESDLFIVCIELQTGVGCVWYRYI